jgi:hypothetical protein
MNQQIPLQIEEKYEGRWVAWDTVDEKVVGDGQTLEEAIAAAAPARQAEHLIWYHHVVPRETVIVGGL